MVGLSLKPLCSEGTNLLLLPSLFGCLFPELGYLLKSIPLPGVINLGWVKMLLEGIGRQHNCTTLSLDKTRVKIPWRERKERNNLISETSIHPLTKMWVKQGFPRQRSSSQTGGRTPQAQLPHEAEPTDSDVVWTDTLSAYWLAITCKRKEPYS